MNFFKSLFGAKKGGEKSEALSENEFVIKCLKEKLSNMNLEVEISNQMIVIKKIDTTIRARVSSKNQHPNAVVLQLDFHIINKELFDEGIYESLAGIGEGKNVEQVIKNGVDAFISGVFTAIIESFNEAHNPNLDIETESNGSIKLWHPKVGHVQVQGNIDLAKVNEDHIFNLLKCEVVRKLKNKRFYWVKVFVSKQINGDIIAQCLLNNKAFPEADMIMKEYARSWEADNTFKSQKQYIIIRQCDKTWKENSFKELQKDNFLRECAEHTINVLETWEQNVSEEDILKRITEFTKDYNLTWELYCFLPSIYCRLIFREPKYSDMVTVMMPDGTKTDLILQDFESYVIAETVAMKSLQMGKDKSKIEKILFLSAEINALNQAVSKGSKMEDLEFIPLTLVAPDGYIIKTND